MPQFFLFLPICITGAGMLIVFRAVAKHLRGRRTRRVLEERRWVAEVEIIEAEARFARARARIAERMAKGPLDCSPEAIVAVIAQPSPPPAERPSAIETLNVGLSLQ